MTLIEFVDSVVGEFTPVVVNGVYFPDVAYIVRSVILVIVIAFMFRALLVVLRSLSR